MRLSKVASATAAVVRARWAAPEAAADGSGPPAGGRWQLIDINRNFLTALVELFI
jgi:hypothetical protein